ncbi:hypothetical protein NMY22_g4937 [Coprinellus aureogranulatus]|nr:hypothetical protein NMY22_g4937 [Coprinellus aureogranulatus]
MVFLHDDTSAKPEAPLDITYLLNTNYPPNDVEEAVVRREIDVLEPSIERVRAQLGELEERLLRYRSIISPIRRVPQETIGEIFTSMLDILPQDYETRTETLLRLALVCKAWNDEAHKSCHWSELRIPISQAAGIPTYKEIEWRFKGLRMVTIEDFGDCECLQSADQNACLLKNSAFLQLLSRYSSLRSISLSLSCIRCFTNLMQSIRIGKEAQLNWSMIRSLTLRINAFHQLQPTTELHHDFNLTKLPPSLTSLSLFLPSPSWHGESFVQLSFPTQSLMSLISLHLSFDWGTDFFLVALQGLLNLQSLQLDGRSSEASKSWEENFQVGEIELPKLRTLDINLTLSAAAVFLPRLSLPALVDVRIGVYKSGELCEKLNYLKARSPGMPSAPTLLSLTVYSAQSQGLHRPESTTSDWEIFDALSAIPSLQHISLRELYFDLRRFLELLERKAEQGGQGFLPCIQSIQVIDLTDLMGGFDFESFLQYVKFRHERTQDMVDPLVVGRSSDSLRRVTFGFRKIPYKLDFGPDSLGGNWELAQGTIELLKNLYGVVVDQVFLSD